MTDRVILSRDGAVAHVRLNRPEQRNGLDLAMFEALIAVGEELCDDRNVRAVVLSGEGKAFCAGLDFKSFLAAPALLPKLLERSGPSPANVAQRAALIWREVPVPVIAAVHGACFGGGFQIALGADLRIVAPAAQLSIMEVRWGIIPDMSITQTALHSTRLDVLKELAFTGRIIDGREAQSLGLATRVAEDPMSEAMALAAAIATNNPDAIRAAKQLFERAPRLSAADALLLETDLQLTLLGSPNQMEAVQANFEKRDPIFRDPE